MDFAHFGLARRPFRPTPDPDLYYPSAAHEAVAAGLRDALADGDGLALVDGDPGTGKTLAVLRFVAGLGPTAPTVYVPAPRFGRPADLFQAILFDLGVRYQGLSDHELRLALTDHLLGGLAAGRPTVVVLDEAQLLGPDLLEEVRLLGNLQTRAAKAAFVVLVAQPALRDRLAGPDAAAVAQRVGVRVRVEPLDRVDAARFLWHQLRVCGGDPATLLSEEALNLLTARCGGLPRVLNRAAALAFTLAASAGEPGVDVEAALEALDRLGLAEEAVAGDDPDVLPHPNRPADGKGRGPKRKTA